MFNSACCSKLLSLLVRQNAIRDYNNPAVLFRSPLLIKALASPLSLCLSIQGNGLGTVDTHFASHEIPKDYPTSSASSCSSQGPFPSRSSSNSTIDSKRVVDDIMDALHRLQKHNVKGRIWSYKDCRKSIFNCLQTFQGRVTPYVLNEVLKHQREANLAMAIFEWADSQPHFFPNARNYSTIIRICGKAKLLDQVQKFFNQMNQRGVPLNCYVFSELMKSHGNVGQVEKAVMHFEDMKSILIYILSKNGWNKRALEVFKEMEAKNVAPDAITFNTIISACGRMGRLGEARSIFQSMAKFGCKPDLITFNALIAIHCKARQIGGVHEILTDMEKAGVKPDIATFTPVLKMLVDNGCNDEVVQNLMNGVIATGATPNEIWYTILINKYIKEQRLEMAEGVLKEMESRFVKPSVVTFNSLLKCYLDKGEYNRVGVLRQKMVKAGVYPDGVWYTILINYHAKNKRMELAEGVLHEMQSEAIMPNKWTFNSLLAGYLSNGEYEKAERLRNEMQNAGLSPDVVHWNTIINKHVKDGEFDVAEKLLQDMKQSNSVDPNIVTFRTLILGYLRVGNYGRVESLLDEMQAFEIVPDVAMYSCISSHYNKCESEEDKHKVLQLLQIVKPKLQSRNQTSSMEERILNSID